MGSAVGLATKCAINVRVYQVGVYTIVDAGLISTVNLGKADVYPATSGKARAAEYLAKYYGVPLSSCALLCDDDNDLELALLVGKAYCPSIASVGFSSWRSGESSLMHWLLQCMRHGCCSCVLFVTKQP